MEQNALQKQIPLKFIKYKNNQEIFTTFIGIANYADQGEKRNLGDLNNDEKDAKF